jgi:hypothetical protein
MFRIFAFHILFFNFLVPGIPKEHGLDEGKFHLQLSRYFGRLPAASTSRDGNGRRVHLSYRRRRQ